MADLVVDLLADHNKRIHELEDRVHRLWLSLGIVEPAQQLPKPKPPIERDGNVIRFPGGSHG